MKVLVTGAAGFIGSHLCERLLKRSELEVIGIDDYIGPTPFLLKQKNLEGMEAHPRFHFIHGNLLTLPLKTLLQDVDVIYHLAAIPGVRSSWGKDFEPYVSNNIMATQKLLEVCKGAKRLKRFIYASTSSIYGERDGKVSEDLAPMPLSPYGVTKLSGEHLCHVYKESFHIPIIVLRYFTVYGPRQRPDMAFHIFIRQMLLGEPITIFGDGTQSRDFTFITDCVKGTEAAMNADGLVGETINIGGKERASVLEILSLLEEISGITVQKNFLDKVNGEPKHTWADISKANELLHYSPNVTLKEGLREAFQYFTTLYRSENK
ncbi:NAD-dependent epimerase/dehydratase family protein [Bacillus carboniphilus]|uniref:NAD-dependent epimerase/dehydratase family protein n=1 Tax=Bacillus carboniphilus TaxID=86663 RepID=A0ABN0WKM6_9BACI